MDSEQIIETWNLFSDYLPAKDKSVVASSYVALIMDFGASESDLKECMGNDDYLDTAILEIFEFDDEEDDIEEVDFE
jgi:hypothetical protein|tara:strand:+ start:811 stop:1041 length:231 start_codon:yes stop_codon:yes gene_type:complete